MKSEKGITLISVTIYVIVMAIVIGIIAVKAASSYRKQKNPKYNFVPSGQTALAFAILTAIWLNTQDPVVFCLSLALSILVAGNRLNDTRNFGEVVFGAFMGPLIVILVYGLTIFRI